MTQNNAKYKTKNPSKINMAKNHEQNKQNK